MRLKLVWVPKYYYNFYEKYVIENFPKEALAYLLFFSHIKQKILGPLFRPQIYNSKKMVDLKK